MFIQQVVRRVQLSRAPAIRRLQHPKDAFVNHGAEQRCLQNAVVFEATAGLRKPEHDLVEREASAGRFPGAFPTVQYCAVIRGISRMTESVR